MIKTANIYLYRTRIYQEYKLCKLLTKQIDMKRGSSARHSVSSRRLGGYSVSQSNTTSRGTSSTLTRRLGSAPGRSSDITSAAYKQLTKSDPSSKSARRPQSSIESRQQQAHEDYAVNLTDIHHLPVYKRPKSGAFSLPPMLSKSYPSYTQQSSNKSDHQSSSSISYNEKQGSIGDNKSIDGAYVDNQQNGVSNSKDEYKT